MSDAKKRVLVVDDEADIRDYLSCLFEDNGFDVETAINGEDGLQKMTLFGPDVVTLDITMPIKTGIQLYREMKMSDTLRRIPVIIVTGITGDFEQFISTRRTVPPPDGYMHKPVDQASLLKLVRQLVSIPKVGF